MSTCQWYVPSAIVRDNKYRFQIKSNQSNLPELLRVSFEYMLISQLHISGNNLTRLGDGVFCGMTKLEKLSLSNNKISYIAPQVFAPTVNIYWLDISHNNITSMTLRPLCQLSKLNELNLGYNKVTHILTHMYNCSSFCCHSICFMSC